MWQYNPADLWVPSLVLVDAGTDQDIHILNNDVVFTDQKISLRADASLNTSSVTFYINNTLHRRETERPFSLSGDNSGNYNEWIKTKGDYQIRVIPYSVSGAAGAPLTYTLTVTDRAEACASGSIVREYWW